jgi:hypothetical protein
MGAIGTFQMIVPVPRLLTVPLPAAVPDDVFHRTWTVSLAPKPNTLTD